MSFVKSQARLRYEKILAGTAPNSSLKMRYLDINTRYTVINLTKYVGLVCWKQQNTDESNQRTN